MNQNLPITTLFMIESLDGKISPGDSDDLDVDKDFRRISGIKEGLHQYYELEQQTDLFSLNTGRVMEKIGVNEKTGEPNKIPVSFIIIDNKPHLNEKGLEYLSKWVKVLYLVTTNKLHPAYPIQNQCDNIVVLPFDDEINLKSLLLTMKNQYGAEKITIQSGGTLNSHWLREKLIDYVSIVIAPCLVGGKDTQSLIGGESLHSQNDLDMIKALKLIHCNILKNNYIHLKYEIIKDTKIDN